MTPEQAEVARKIASAFLSVAIGQRDTSADSRKSEMALLKQATGWRAVDGLDDIGRPCREIRFTGENTRTIIDFARKGSFLAYSCLCEIAADMTNRNEKLPLPLQQYMVRDAPRFKRTRGRGAGADWIRESAIAGAVLALTEKNGFNRVRSSATRDLADPGDAESACSIVAEVCVKQFRMKRKTEISVEKTYERYRDMAAWLWFEGGKMPTKFDI